MDDTKNLQSAYRGELNQLMIEISNEKEIINQLIRSLQRLDKLWDMRLKYEEHLNANKRNNSRSGEIFKIIVKCPDANFTITSTETTISSITSTTDTRSNLL